MAFLHVSDNSFTISDIVFADSGAVTVRPCFVQYSFPCGIECDGAREKLTTCCFIIVHAVTGQCSCMSIECLNLFAGSSINRNCFIAGNSVDQDLRHLGDISSLADDFKIRAECCCQYPIDRLPID